MTLQQEKTYKRSFVVAEEGADKARNRKRKLKKCLTISQIMTQQFILLIWKK